MASNSTRIRWIVPLAVCCAIAMGAVLQADNADNTVEGTIVARTETTIDVQADGDQQPVRYLLNPTSAHYDPKVLAFMKSLTVGSDIRLHWIPYEGRKLVNHVDVLAAGGDGKGLLQGTVTAIAVTNPTGMHYIELRDDSGKTEQYSPQWTGHGFDETMLTAIARRHIGERVEIRVNVDDHPRVVSMIVIALAPDAAQSADAGTVVGRVTARDKTSLTIKSEAGEELHLLVQDVVGAKDQQDRAMIKAMAKVKVGDKLSAQWFRDGERRLVWIKPAGSPTSAPVRAPAAAPGK